MNTLIESLQLAVALILDGDAELWRIAALSLQVSGTAVVVGAVLGLLLGAWLAVARFPGHGVLVWLINTLLALPAVVVGLLVYLLLSRAGPLGSLGLLFTPTAMVIAQSLLVTPLIAALSRQLVQAALDEGGEQLRALGAAPLTCALLMLLHERLAVLTIVLTAFGRAVAEVGAVMIVGGNIAGITRVMTTAIALETSKGDLALALGLGLVLLALVGLVNGLILLLQHGAARAAPAPASSTSPGVSTASASARISSPTSSVSAHSADKPRPQPLLRLCDVTLHLSRQPVLRDVSLQVYRGDSLALLGANGSGKTTLLRLLQGLLPHQGELRRLALSPEGRLPRMSMVFQKPFLLRLSVQRNIRLALWLSGVPQPEHAARCRHALTRVGLLGLAHRPARALSGGQQQRLALARALATQPELLLLDEPTASLDPSARREIEALIEHIAASGVTLIMSTHNLGQAKRLAKRVAYLEAGRLVVACETEQFFNDPHLPTEALQFLRGELPWT